jgi:hypothetical protein
MCGADRHPPVPRGRVDDSGLERVQEGLFAFGLPTV